MRIYTIKPLTIDGDPLAIEDVSDETIKTVRKCLDHVLGCYERFLTAQHYDIGLRIAPNACVPTLFVGGHTHGPTEMVVSLVENIEELPHDATRQIESMSIHELHHMQRRGTVGYGETLHEVLITEGLACLAEVQHFPKSFIPYIQSNSTEIKKLLKTYAKEKNITDYDHDRWFFGGGDLPVWAGYKLGYYLAKNRADSIKKTSWELVDQLVSPGG